ncbi:rhodanese-like domain-containing protein [Halioxenophilus sp. WMMB6]|uniref:rhodanese-like domain-containing protein n=1 Tax=Halioxenophilus sp. WMMB6 TaxID=3073815 RepID=UPI00295EDB66|nr:rhodanese-like domain-containing protein [Halioxenophilus sp. WMMB6]
MLPFKRLLSSLTLALGLSLPVLAIAELPDNVVWLDVRTAQEFADGHVDGALNIPHTEVSAQAASALPDKEAPIYVYCRSGHRAGLAKASLEALGYTQVLNIGGLTDAEALIEQQSESAE